MTRFGSMVRARPAYRRAIVPVGAAVGALLGFGFAAALPATYEAISTVSVVASTTSDDISQRSLDYAQRAVAATTAAATPLDGAVAVVPREATGEIWSTASSSDKGDAISRSHSAATQLADAVDSTVWSVSGIELAGTPSPGVLVSDDSVPTIVRTAILGALLGIAVGSALAIGPIRNQPQEWRRDDV